MARQDKLTPSEEANAPSEDSLDDFRQIDLRLHLNEVVEVEAEQLRAGACRQPTRRELCRLACEMYDARRRRDRMLNGQLFGEPAWDMLLALYCLPARGEVLAVTSLSNAAEVPESTGLRWQRTLIKEGLIERGPTVRGGGQLVRLTSKGRSLLENYLTWLFYLGTPTPPHPERAGG